MEDSVEFRIEDMGWIDNAEHLSDTQDLLIYSCIGDVYMQDFKKNTVHIRNVPIIHFLSGIWDSMPILTILGAEARIGQPFRNATTSLCMRDNELVVTHIEEWLDSKPQEVYFKSIMIFSDEIYREAERIFRILDTRINVQSCGIPVLGALSLLRASGKTKAINI